jgi:hypothetical protein
LRTQIENELRCWPAAPENQQFEKEQNLQVDLTPFLCRL